MSKMAAPSCSACGGTFACTNCERTLRKQFATMHEVDFQHLVMNAGEISGVHRFFDETKLQALYATKYPVGPRGGALIDFGRAVVLECFLPYSDKAGALPFVPMPFDGTTLLHDVGRKRDIDVRQIERCKSRMCGCDMYPTGWVLPRPAARALLATTDSFLNDHGRQLPGLVGGSWALVYDTLTFMRKCYFSETFTLPKREESREARAERARSRSTGGWKHAHPEHARRRC